MLRIPSENIFLIKSKGLNAIKKASLAEDAPKIIAIKASLNTPSIRLTKIKTLTDAAFLIIFLTNFP